MSFQSALPRGERRCSVCKTQNQIFLFQSALPRGERRRQHHEIQTLFDFNPRSREGSDSSGTPDPPSVVEFQSALPRGERPSGTPDPPSVVEFQSALPRGERRTYWICLHGFYPDFNPRSREGSDFQFVLCASHKYISIRAPARGATVEFFQRCLADIFQSALPRGERHRIVTSHHAMWIFQSALPRGERPKVLLPDVIIMEFQSALPRGERRCLIVSFRIYKNFNPRSREGSDPSDNVTLAIPDISIRAPARGATDSISSTNLSHRFQSALPRGERR